MNSSILIRDGVLVHTRTEGGRLIVPSGVREVGSGDGPLAPESSAWKVVLPEGVEVIRKNAFRGCPELSHVVLPQTLRIIEDGAFSECSLLESITIPPLVTSIPDNAFSFCRELERISLPEGLKSIGDYAFNMCVRLNELSLPSTLETVGDYAFRKCRFNDLVLPPGVRELPQHLFFSSHLKSLSAVGAVNVPLNNGFCPNSLTTLTVPHISIQNIPTGNKKAALKGFVNWEAQGGTTEPEVRDSYVNYLRARRKYLADEAIENLPLLNFLLKEALLPQDLFEIYLQKANLAGNTEAVAMLLDYQNRHLGTPDPEEELRRMMRKLESDTLSLSEFRNNWRSRKKNPEGTIMLQEYLGADTSLMLPARKGQVQVTELANGLFEGNRKLTSIFIPEGYRVLGERSFKDCTGLQRVELPDSVEIMGDFIFQGCSSLTEIRLPKSLRVLGRSAFSGCTALREICLPSGLTEVSHSTFLDCTSLTSLSLPDTVRVIQYYAFSGCRNLTHIRISSTLQPAYIRSSAFEGTLSLLELELYGNPNPDLIRCMFQLCPCLKRLSFTSEDPNTHSVQWKSGSFQKTPELRELFLPAHLRRFDAIAFQNFPNLSSWEADPNNPWICSDGPFLFSKDRTKLLRVIPTLSGAVFIPNSVTTICRNAFAWCKSLKEVTIPASVREIQKWAFSSCKSLTDVRFLGSPESVAEQAFKGCPVAKHLTLPR